MTCEETASEGPRRVHVGVGQLVTVVALQSALMLPLSMILRMDGDEGFYSMASKLVAHHRVLYVDFWYQQAPLLPYVYGSWQKLFGESWYSLRLLSCVLAVGLGTLLYWHVARRYSSRALAAFAVTFYASAPLVLQWFLIVKTYALSSLLLFVGYTIAERADRTGYDGRRRWWYWTCSGFFAALAADVRFVLAPAALVFLYYAMRSRTRGERRYGNLIAVVAGLVTGLLPSIYFFLRGPGRFVNDTVTSQTTRSNMDFGSSINQKLRVLGAVLSTPHVLLAAIAIATVVTMLIRQRQRVPMAIALVAVLSLANLAPTPSYTQYFSIVVPFLVIGALELVPIIRGAIPNSGSTQLTRLLCTIGVGAVGLSLVATAQTVDTRNAPISFLGDAYPRPSQVRTVSKAIDHLTSPGEVVLSLWPGWLYETHTQPFPGTESHFIPIVAAQSGISPTRLARYNMTTYARIREAIQERRVRVVVGLPFSVTSSLLARSGYRQVKIVDGVHIYIRAG